MGTRGLLGFIMAAQRHASYNHFDSYPSGLGLDIVKFILSLKPEEYAEMDRLVREITWVDGNAVPSPELQKQYSKMGFSNVNVGEQTLDDWYCLLHKTQGAAALPAIKSGQLKHMIESSEHDFDTRLQSAGNHQADFAIVASFLRDSLFCEWAYFIDFENQKLETWAAGKKVDEVTFEKLIQEGTDYINTLE